RRCRKTGRELSQEFSGTAGASGRTSIRGHREPIAHQWKYREWRLNAIRLAARVWQCPATAIAVQRDDVLQWQQCAFRCAVIFDCRTKHAETGLQPASGIHRSEWTAADSPHLSNGTIHGFIPAGAKS